MKWLEALDTRRIALIIALGASLAYANALGGQFVVDDTEQRIECRLNRITTIYCDVTIENFLQNLGIGDQSLSFANEFLDPSL